MLMTAQLRQQEDRVKWTEAIHDAEKENARLKDEDVAQDHRLIQKMQRIVDAEMELALKEGQEVLRGRRKAPISIVKP